jgi:hypothetical protein
MKKLLSLLGLSAVVATMLVAGPAAAAPDTGSAAKPIAATSGAPTVRQDWAQAAAPLRATGASTQAAVSSRFYWGARNGWWVLNLSGLGVVPGQAITVSGTESDGAGNEIIGAAHISTYNVSVTNNVVSILIFIDWGSPINVWVHYVG